ncbi:hypothetical protein [Bacillus wiedmannii]|nr:hypothetical protein [Bacillus wiedmannii]
MRVSKLAVVLSFVSAKDVLGITQVKETERTTVGIDIIFFIDISLPL